MMEWLIYAFVIGFAGSFHCVGMCGAIALSLPIQHLKPQQKNIGIVLYNFGRIIAYSIIGLLFGVIGRVLYLGGLQQTISIVVGAIILVLVVLNYLGKKKWQPKLANRFQFFVQQFLSKAIVKKNTLSTFSIGFLNGWLPCGMVYFAVASALSSSSIINAILFMVMFGVGTIPLMILVSYFGLFVKVSLRNTIKKAMPYFMLAMGILFILRGLNLNIPFVSPYIDNSATHTISCH